MNNKPFFWFLIDGTIQNDWLKEFKENSILLSGIALSLETYQNTDVEILKINQSTFKIPLSIYLSNEKDVSQVNAEYFENLIILFDKKAIEDSLQNNAFSFKLSWSANSGINGLVEQLTDYFLFRSINSLSKVVIEFEPALLRTIPDFFRLMSKLGVSNYLIKYSKENITLIKECMNLPESITNIISEKSFTPFNNWRSEIDELDKLLIETLAKRMLIINKMGVHKKQNNLPLFEPYRWKEILISRKNIAKEAGLDEELTGRIFEAIHLAAIKRMIEIERGE